MFESTEPLTIKRVSEEELIQCKHIPERTKCKALEILRKAKEDNIWDNNDPTGLANAAVYVALVLESR
jgi:transcription initiation factor TFIIIB Brf1 subunit/transcription initiation factor TFIIB